MIEEGVTQLTASLSVGTDLRLRGGLLEELIADAVAVIHNRELWGAGVRLRLWDPLDPLDPHRGYSSL